MNELQKNDVAQNTGKTLEKASIKVKSSNILTILKTGGIKYQQV